MRYSGEMVRKGIHFSSLAIPVGLFLLPTDLSKPILLVATLVALAIDVIRLQLPQVRTLFYFLFGRIIREHERFNLIGGTYLLIAALICIYAFEQGIAVVCMAFLVVGDTMAALIGRRWGRIKILDKSLEGSLSCLTSCVVMGGLYIIASRYYPATEVTWIMVVVGSGIATLFELLPIPLDDNLRIPLSAGFAMSLVG